MKAVILARVSTEEQKDAGNSLPAQIERLQNYCKRKGFEVIERIADISRHSNWRLKIFTDSPREEVLSWIKTADVFVLNSHYEGFSHVLVEAMTLGTPVVVTNIRANKSLVGGAGLLVSPRDDTALEQALIEVERNPKEAQDRARAGQERAKSFELSYTLDLTANFLKLL